MNVYTRARIRDYAAEEAERVNLVLAILADSLRHKGETWMREVSNDRPRLRRIAENRAAVFGDGSRSLVLWIEYEWLRAYSTPLQTVAQCERSRSAIETEGA